MSAKVKNYGAVLSIFIFEVLAFTSFTLANSYLLFGLFGFLVAAFVGVMTYDRFKTKGDTSFLIFLIPLVLFIVLTLVSNFSRTALSLSDSLIIFIALISFLCVGYMVRFVDGFKIKTALHAVYGGLFILMFISMCYAMVYYTPFYTWLYRNKVIYYDGAPVRIADSVPMLLGFKFEDVKVQYLSLFGTMLFTSIVGLRFINPKKETRDFILYSFYALMGLITLMFLPNKINFITDFFIVLFLLFITFYPKKGKPMKVMKWILTIGLSIAGVLLLIFVINAQSTWGFAKGLQDSIKGNAMLDKLFNSNGLSASYKLALDGIFTGDFLLGRPISVSPDGTEFRGLIGLNKTLIPGFTNSMFFDTFTTSGLFGVIAFIAFIIMTIGSVVRYFNKTEDQDSVKHLVVAFIGSFFIYSAFALPVTINAHYITFNPFFKNAMFLITLFFIGYTYTAKEKKAKPVEFISEVNDEDKQGEKEEVKDEINL